MTRTFYEKCGRIIPKSRQIEETDKGEPTGKLYCCFECFMDNQINKQGGKKENGN